MRLEVLKDSLAGIAFVLIQVLLFQHLSILGATPDVLLLYLLWLALKYDRLQLVLYAAGLGLLQDALFDFWGIHMFSKVLLCFMIHGLIGRYTETRLLLWQVFVFILGAAFVHNIIFISMSSFVEAYSVGFAPVIFLLVSSLYTAAIGTALFIFKGN